jgi:hypothetical protein
VLDHTHGARKSGDNHGNTPIKRLRDARKLALRRAAPAPLRRSRRCRCAGESS